MATIERFGPTRRGGPVFRWLGEPLAIDLANTVMVLRDGEDETVDLIASGGELEAWLEAERERLGGYGLQAPSDHDLVRELRDAVRAALRAAAENEPLPGWAVERLNAASAAAPVSPLLAADGAGDSPEGGGSRAARRAEADPAAGTLPSLLGRLSREAIELLTGPRASELQVCRAPSCGMVYLGTRRWCCAACGNRARAARHYERRRAA
jgi:predicted RNA-binding Zn ribbon-like protein